MDTQVHSRDCPDDSVITHAHGVTQVVRVEFGKELMVLLAILIAVIGADGVVMGLNLARQQELQYHFDNLDRQYRMVELKLDDWTVVAHRAGLALTGDYTRGPEGNLDSKSFHPKQLRGK